MGQHSLSELWASMPLFAKIIWFVLAIMSVWSLSVAIDKWWGLRKAQAETRKDGRPRLPPGQKLTEGFPVLDLGVQPEIPPGEWQLRIDGLVERPTRLTWALLSP